MSITDLIETFDSIARDALFKSGALRWCEFHDIPVRQSDSDAERHAYALATVEAKRLGFGECLEDVRTAVENCLIEAADDECPECAALRAD